MKKCNIFRHNWSEWKQLETYKIYDPGITTSQADVDKYKCLYSTTYYQERICLDCKYKEVESKKVFN